MEDKVMLKDGKYKNRLIDVFASIFLFDPYELEKVDDSIIVDYILKHISDDVSNHYLLASNIGLDMEENGICSTDRLRNNIVAILALSTQEPYKTIFLFIDKIRKSYESEIVINYRLSHNVLTYFEEQLTRSILLQYLKLALRKIPKRKSIKITSKTSDMLYKEYDGNSLQNLKIDMIEYFLYYHHLFNLIEIYDFTDYLIISIKDPFEKII